VSRIPIPDAEGWDSVACSGRRAANELSRVVARRIGMKDKCVVRWALMHEECQERRTTELLCGMETC
jgi:hypothetical protein